MHTTPGRRWRRTRLARALGLDRNPLRRASDRAEAWIRIGLLAVFLIAGPLAAIGAGGWAYHGGTTTAPVHTTAPARTATATALTGAGLTRAGQASQTWARARWQSTGTSPRTDDAVAAVMTLALTGLALLAAQRLIRALLTRRRLAAWESAWSRIGPQWTRGRP